MSDLISRSVLLKKIEEEYDLNYGEILINPERFYEMVEAIPTAYDIEKVVAELETRQDDIQVDISLHDFYIQGYSSAIDYAIDIVRKGGV